jgi:DNA polymerase-3 subunit epsilon
MREIIIDTETTGLDPLSGHRVVEIGAVELVDHASTGRTFHCYLNPERAMPADAIAVHGEFLADKHLFADVTDELASLRRRRAASSLTKTDAESRADLPLRNRR